MSATESSIGSSAGAAPPSAPSAPAATPVESSPQPVAATSAAASPAVPSIDAAAPSATPGAPPPSQPEAPTSLEQVKARYHERLENIAGTEGTQPQQTTPPVEAQPTTPAPVAPAEPTPAPVEAQPAEPVVPDTPEPVADLAAADVIETGDDNDYLETPLTTVEDLEKRFPRVSKKVLGEVAKLETHRAQLLEQRNAIGGEDGAGISAIINPILLGVEDPTDADVDAIVDQIVLPENAHAVKLWKKMSERLVSLQMDDPETGREFGSNLISEEFGKNADGTDFDFWGMQPLEFVELLVNAAKFRGEEGEGLINREFIEHELAANKAPEPTEREKQLQAKVEELETKTQTERVAAEAETKRKDEQQRTAYKTQATGFISHRLNDAILPLATKANWVPTDEAGPQAGKMKTWGRMVTNDISTHVLGPVNRPTPGYQEVLDMIDNGNAFDAAGHALPRFLRKVEPLERKAKARFTEIERELASEFKFAAQTSRAAQLVKQNGGTTEATPTAPPPLAVTPPPRPANQQETTEERLAKVREKYRTTAQGAQQQSGVL